MRRIVVLLMAALLLTCCGKSGNGIVEAHAQSSKEIPVYAAQEESSTWLEKTPLIEEQKDFLRNHLNPDGVGLVKQMWSFTKIAKNNLDDAAAAFGEAAFQKRVSSLTRRSKELIQVTMAHIIPIAANLRGGEKIVAYYSPVKDLLILTKWNSSLRIQDARFMTGTRFLGISDPGRRVTEQFPDRPRTQFGIFVEVYRQVANQVYSKYPMYGSDQNLELPDLMNAEDFERNLVERVQAITNLLALGPPLERKRILEKWGIAVQEGNVTAIEGLQSDASLIKAKEIVILDSVHRGNLSVVFSAPWPRSENWIVVLASTNPPHLWYDLRLQADGKVLVNDIGFIHTIY